MIDLEVIKADILARCAAEQAEGWETVGSFRIETLLALVGEVERLRVLGPDTEARVTVEARAIASGMLKPVVDSWKAEVARVSDLRDVAAKEASTLRDDNGMLRDQLIDLREQHAEQLTLAREEGRREACADMVAWLQARIALHERALRAEWEAADTGDFTRSKYTEAKAMLAVIESGAFHREEKA